MSTKYIFVTGGVVSGLGKGITAASLGRLLKARGYSVVLQKLDPYINVDPGTMSPYQHGEVFVTDDGAETDLDLGHYERFVDENLTADCSITTGKIYWSVIQKERKGEYLGGTVQVIPHITNEIKDRIYSVGKAKHADIVITEIGGTVGDIESLPYLEAIRQVAADVGRANTVYIHVTYIPLVSGSGELKTKPTQHSVKELLSLGIQPDIVVCRTDHTIPQELRDKISLFCNIRPDCVIENKTCDILYEAPMMLEKHGLGMAVCSLLSLDNKFPDLSDWQEMLGRICRVSKKVSIAVVGKYVSLPDAYLSVAEALRHGGFENSAKVEIDWVDSGEITDENAAERLSAYDGILIPGGFGERGIAGKISAVHYARENNVPFFGICLGMQMAVVEYSRNVLGLSDADSAEFSVTTQNPVIHIMPDQLNVTDKGGTMRLGQYECILAEGTKVRDIYGTGTIFERHRHRYEFNNNYRDALTEKGMVLSGKSPDGRLVEIIELPNHPWFIGVQFHPEFKSRPNKAHPLFKSFIKASVEYREKRQAEADNKKKCL